MDKNYKTMFCLFFSSGNVNRKELKIICQQKNEKMHKEKEKNSKPYLPHISPAGKDQILHKYYVLL